jgi:restriction system protein
MKKYFRIMLGKGSQYAPECFAGNFIGADYDIKQDLSHELPEDWKEFNKKFIPIYISMHPDKSRVAAGLSCGFLWTVSKGIIKGDIVLCPDGSGSYHVGEVSSDYYYKPGEILQHRRSVVWLPTKIQRTAMSESLRYATGAIGAVSNISGYGDEIEKLINGVKAPKLISTDESVVDPFAFAMEQHLEEFLFKNWHHTELGKEYDIFEDDKDRIGKQYAIGNGNKIDILAISKNKKTLLVVELKRGRASDEVVGQTLRYMGYVQELLAESGQTVKGLIVAHEDDEHIKRALAMVPSISFYRYQVSFKLIKG